MGTPAVPSWTRLVPANENRKAETGHEAFRILRAVAAQNVQVLRASQNIEGTCGTQPRPPSAILLQTVEVEAGHEEVPDAVGDRPPCCVYFSPRRRGWVLETEALQGLWIIRTGVAGLQGVVIDKIHDKIHDKSNGCSPEKVTRTSKSKGRCRMSCAPFVVLPFLSAPCIDDIWRSKYLTKKD